MEIPEMWPRSGVRGGQLEQVLQEVLNATYDVAPQPGDIVPRYVQWATSSCQKLAPVLASVDVDALIRTPAYWTTLALPTAAPHGTQLVNAELDERRSALQEHLAALEASRLRFTPDRPTNYVVPDTNVLLEHPGGLAGIDWATVLDRNLQPFDDIRVVIPLGVVDELDNLKRVSKAEKRAQTALKAIYGHFGTSIAARRVIRGGDAEDGRVFIELLMDGPAHIRLPRMDDELIRVTSRLSAFTPSAPIFLTYDTGAAFRATAAGLHHVRLVHGEAEK